MANNHFVFGGIEDLKAQLRTMPAALKGEGAEIVMHAATSAKADVAAIYAAHRVSGELAKGLTLTVEAIGPFGTRATVRNRGNLATIYERGSEARHWKRNGKYVGRMPAANVFIPTMIRARAAMYAKLAALLERHGLTVTGRAEAA